MPKLRKVTPPEGAAQKAPMSFKQATDLLRERGYSVTGDGGSLFLVARDQPAEQRLLDRAGGIAKAQAERERTTDESAPSSFVVRRSSAPDEAPLITLAELDAAAAWLPGPDERGVFRRPPGMAERVHLSPDQLLDGRWQPRQQMDEAKLQELADSIHEHGVLEDLIAIMNSAGQLELVAGHRRKLAAIRAGVEVVPVKIVEVTASQARALALISNDQREDLTDVERGQAYETIIREERISEAELARRLSRPRSYIQQRRALATAALEIAEALAGGQISFTLARGICAGAPGHHPAQIQALKEIQNRQSWQGPATEQDAQRYAEEAILSTAKATLRDLGWKVERFYAGDKNLTVVYSDRDRPKAWTSAEVLAALREQRRPSTEGEIPLAATIEPADRTAMRRRGWAIDEGPFAPWILAKAPKAKFLRVEEVGALVEQARKDLGDLQARYTAAGWTLKLRGGGDSDDFEAKTKEGRTEHCYSWTMAKQLIKRIEDGKEAREPATTVRQCERCKETKATHYWRNNYYCQECIAELTAEEQRIRAELRQELEQEAGEWIAAAPEHILRLLVADGENERLGTKLYTPRERKAPLIRAAPIESLREALLDDLVELAYTWRDMDLGGHAVADEIAVGEEGETT